MKKILIVNTYLSNGGAAIAACRLAEALSRYSNDIQVAMLTLHADNSSLDCLPFEVQSIVPNGKIILGERLNFFAERLQIFLANGFKKDKIFHISTALWGQDISNHPLVKWADIIHLHWICQGMISLSSLEKLSKLNKKIFWTLHDMWPITAVSPHLKNPNIYESPWSAKEKRLVATVWLKKQRIYSIIKPTFIGCSKWISEKARDSYLTKGCKVYSIPNPIDVDKYYPREKLNDGNFYLIFGAVNTADERKGFRKILEALDYIHKNGYFEKYNIKVIAFGNLSRVAQEKLKPYNVEKIGFVSSQMDMINLYNKANCLVVPSLYENLPNTIMEAMSCATPCIAFNVGGISEMIDDTITGFISPSPFDDDTKAPTLADNIINMARIYHDDIGTYNNMCNNSRLKAIENYSMDKVASRFVQLYNE